jgi:hypothetical protein
MHWGTAWNTLEIDRIVTQILRDVEGIDHEPF